MVAATTQSERYCPAGHVMDPTWTSCPYCDAESRSRERTFTANSYSADAVASNERRTSIGDAYSGSKRETKVMPSAGQSGPPSPAGQGDTRRIVGFLITYDWKPEGWSFEVREGKNYIGAGKVGSAPGEPYCDIRIPDDKKMSSVHALILCRAGQFDIVDVQSSNGTFLNGELVPLQGTPLPNYAEVLTGSTVWKFVKVDPEGVSQRATPQPRPQAPEPETKEPPKKPDRTIAG